MLRIAHLVPFVALVVSVQAQDTLSTAVWDVVRCNEQLSFSFPSEHFVTDSLGPRIFSAEDASAIYQVLYFADVSPGYINSVKRLDEVYEQIIQGMLETMPGGEVLSRRPREVGNARALQMTAAMEQAGERWIVEGVLLSTERRAYQFVVLHRPDVQPDVERLFNSITLDPTIDVEEQMTTDIVGLFSPDSWGRLIGILLLAGGAVVVWRVSRRK